MNFTIDRNGYTNKMTFTDLAVNRGNSGPKVVAIFVK